MFLAPMVLIAVLHVCCTLLQFNAARFFMGHVVD